MKKIMLYLFLGHGLGLGFCQGQTTVFDLPAPETVQYLVKGNNQLEKYTNQITAYVLPMGIAIDSVAIFKNNHEKQKEAMDLIQDYGEEMEKVMAIAQKELSRSELDTLADTISTILENKDFRNRFIHDLMEENAKKKSGSKESPISLIGSLPTATPGPDSQTQTKTVSGCEFFPEQNEITYTYIEPGLFDIQTKEIEYIFRGNVELKGKPYRA